jgi:glutamate carboxypeptidase
MSKGTMPEGSFVLKTTMQGVVCFVLLVGIVAPVTAAPDGPMWALVQRERPAVVETLRQLVTIESGSRDKDGLDRLAVFVGQRLSVLGSRVEYHEPSSSEIYRLYDTPDVLGKIVIGRFEGTGSRKIMLLAHMDTVYPQGTLASRPFRIQGNRAYGPGIADDKGGIALILHTLSLLQEVGSHEFGTLTVVVNGDEEISSPASRALIQRLAAEHDVVLSCEPPLSKKDEITLATSGIGVATLAVKGKAAHAGVNPEQGRNAIVELAHRILQTNDLSDPERRIKFNWTLMSGGLVRNMIPDQATATADVRVNRLADLDVIEQRYRERVAAQIPLIPDTKVEARFEQRRPPLEATDASRFVARTAQAIYAEIGHKLSVDESGVGGGTDAAFAAASGKPAVVESFGLIGFGFHSSEEEYVDLDSIEPRLYLLARLIIETSRASIK